MVDGCQAPPALAGCGWRSSISPISAAAPVGFIDLDPRWVKKVISNKHFDQAKAYMDHVIDQAGRTILKKSQDQRFVYHAQACSEALGEKGESISECQHPRRVLPGGTVMAPQYGRFIVEEVLENRASGFYPTYGNTLIDSKPRAFLAKREDNYSITYYAPQPRARCCASWIPKQYDPNKELRRMWAAWN